MKCDGSNPCSNCSKRCQTCQYSAIKPARRAGQASSQLPYVGIIDLENTEVSPSVQTREPIRKPESTLDDGETLVPREARLLQNAQGKLIFIGDCAPLSFLQTVRHLITSCVDETAFTNQFGQDTMLEQVEPQEIMHMHSQPVCDHRRRFSFVFCNFALKDSIFLLSLTSIYIQGYRERISDRRSCHDLPVYDLRTHRCF